MYDMIICHTTMAMTNDKLEHSHHGNILEIGFSLNLDEC